MLDTCSRGRQLGRTIGRGRAPSSTMRAGASAIEALREAVARCSAFGGTRARAHGAPATRAQASLRSCQLASPGRRVSSPSPARPSAGDPARTRDPRSVRPRSRRHADRRPWLDHGRLGRARIRSATERRRTRAASRTPSCRPRARACIRFRSDRCMPASSSPAISASPPTARTWCGWSSGSARCTRASSG